MKKLFLALLFCLLPAAALGQTARVVATCGSLSTTYDVGSTNVQTMDINGNLCSSGKPGTYPAGATPITGSSGNVANAQAQAFITGVAGKTSYITGFQVTAAGSTGALAVNVQIAGVITGTMSYTFTFPAGVAVGAQPLIVTFPVPVPASAANTTISITLPAGGAGNTNAAVSIQGFQL